MYSTQYGDRTSPMDKHVGVMMDTHGLESSPVTPQMFGNAGREHMEKYGKKTCYNFLIKGNSHFFILMHGIL